MRIWTPAEVQRFLAFVADDPPSAMWRLFVVTGMRRGEVAGFDVQLQHEWTFDDRRGQWRVVHISEADPNVPPPQQTSELPDCVGVVNAGGEHVGCVERSLLDAARPLDSEYPRGLPVRGDNGELVGYLPTGAHFVPLALIDRLDEVRACEDQLVSMRLGRRDRVTARCRDLLVAIGVSANELDK
jgi:hypothetical protein